MKVVVIYGTNYKRTSYNFANNILSKLGNIDKTEFFLPKDMPSNCVGCLNCFYKGEDKCPHYEKMNNIVQSMLESNLIVLVSPVYCFDVTGAMKTFLDHLGYAWLSHRPYPEMFKKVGLVISTAAGAGCKRTLKTMELSLSYIGVSKVYKFGFSLFAESLDMIGKRRMQKINIKANKITCKIKKKLKNRVKLKPSFPYNIIYKFMILNQKMNKWNELDKSHWEKRGWLDDKKPWKIYK